MENKFLSQFPKYPKGSPVNPINFLLSAKRNLFVNELLSEYSYGIKRNQSKIESFIIDEKTLITRVFYANKSHLKEFIFKHTIDDITDRVFDLKKAGIIFNDYEVLNEELNHFLPYVKIVNYNNRKYYLYQKLNNNIHTYIKNSPYMSSNYINRIESNNELNTIKIYTLKEKISDVKNNNEVVEKKIYKIDSGNIKLKDYDLYLESIFTSKKGKDYQYRLDIKENPLASSKTSQKSVILKLSDNKNSKILFTLNNMGIFYQLTNDEKHMSIFKSNLSSNISVETGFKELSNDNGTLFCYELNSQKEIMKGDSYNSIMYSKTTHITSFDKDIMNNDGQEIISLLTDLDKKIIINHTDYFNILLKETEEINDLLDFNENIDSINYTLQLESICNKILPTIIDMTENIKDNLKKNLLLSNKYKNN